MALPIFRWLIVCALLTFLAPAGLGQDAGKKKDRPIAGPPPKETAAASLDRLLDWRPIGPANMGGRITSLAVFEADPTCFYVATASGGILKTVNNGSTFTHQFDREATVSLGAVAVAPTNRDIVWAGTGEANPRNSVSWGDGVYKSTDGGKTWKNMGLKQSFQIGKIVIHPKNPDIVYVAALGRLYGPNKERGLYKTKDGGKTWEQLWHLDDRTGVVDLIMHPNDPDMLLLAAWERRRDEFDSFLGPAKAPPGADGYAPVVTHGPGSGIYKSTDGGRTWKKLSHGLPRAKMGRIGLDWSRKNPNLIVAVIDTDQAGKGLPPSKAFIGLAIETDPKGVRIKTVVPKSPAAAAKLAVGDRLLSLDGKLLKTSADFLLFLQKKQPRDKVRLEVLRGPKKIEAEITLVERPGTPKKGGKGAKGGKGPSTRPSLGVRIEPSDDGPVIVELVEKASAEKAGLKVGDVLLTIDGKKIASLKTLIETLSARRIGDTVQVGYRRGKENRVIGIKLDVPPPGVPGRPYSGGILGGQRPNVQDQQGPEGPDTGGVYKSFDAGETWTRVNSLNERPFYFSVVRCDPNDENTIYSLGVKLWRSTDGGRTFSAEGIQAGVHPDHHDMWIDPRDSRHLVLGTDGGVYVSYDRAAHWEMLDHLALGQFYHVGVDNRRPYNVYGGLQDNGSWGGPSNTLRPTGPTNADFRFIQGGDGFVCRVDPHDPDIVYSESQNGNMFRRNLRTGEGKSLRPKVQPGAGRYRFNWNTPFILSHHNPHIFYAAANYVFRSVKQGEDLRIISPEITRTERGSATALGESPRDPNVLWVGSDDGAVWVTRDGGKSWANVTANVPLPGPRWVSSIEASRASTGRCYVVFDAHRSDDDAPYVYVTEDFGKSWRPLHAGLPKGSTRVLREDLRDPDLLYLGTEFAVFASIDRGTHWLRINGKELPTVAIHEIAQPTTADEIVVATHGRSLWVLNVGTLRQLKPRHFALADADKGPKARATLFTPTDVTRWQYDFRRESMFRTGTRVFIGRNPTRDAVFDFLLPEQAEAVSLRILDVSGNLVRSLDLAKEKAPGFHRVTWNLVAGPAPKGEKRKPFTPYGQPVKPGVYRVVLGVDGTESESTLTIEADPRTGLSGNAADEAEELRKLMKEQP